MIKYRYASTARVWAGEMRRIKKKDMTRGPKISQLPLAESRACLRGGGPPEWPAAVEPHRRFGSRPISEWSWSNRTRSLAWTQSEQRMRPDHQPVIAVHTQVNSIETQVRDMKHVKLQDRVAHLEEEVFGETRA